MVTDQKGNFYNSRNFVSWKENLLKNEKDKKNCKELQGWTLNVQESGHNLPVHLSHPNTEEWKQ